MRSQFSAQPRGLTLLVIALLGFCVHRPALGTIGFEYNVPPDSLPLSGGGAPLLSTGETANLYAGGELANLTTQPGSVLNIFGGQVTPGASLGGNVNMHGGVIREFAGFGSQGIVNVYNGSITGGVNILGSMNLFGGSVGSGSFIKSGATVNVAGGSLGPNFNVQGGVVNLSAGSIGDHIAVSSQATLNIRAITALLNGAPIPGLTVGNTITVNDRGSFNLTGQLAGGSPFDFQLNSSFGPWLSGTTDLFENAATVRITLVPEPAGLCTAALGLIVGVAIAKSRGRGARASRSGSR